mmetsp:Transcript_45355/g.112650  ORF Transcript_45355/g.112650 Transcript_45355/m.112650 type:complete len:202 (-) Transcript_45355:444-1049(-)
MSSMPRLACSRAAGMATAGPMPMISGGTPTTANDTNLPMMGRCSRSAALRRASRQRAAPSDTWLELPAVVDPPFWKAGLSLDSVSIEVPARMPSSLSMTTCFSSPLLSLTRAMTGTISSLKRPVFCAVAAFAWEATASWSCCCRVMPYLVTTFSLVMPMGRRQLRAASCSNTEGLSFSGLSESCIECCVMVSTPPARPMSM